MSFLIKHSLFAILNTTVEAGGGRKGREPQRVLLLVMQNETHTRNKRSPSQKQMRISCLFFFLSELKKMIK